MKTYSQYRADARAALKGNWGSMALVALVYVLVTMVFIGPFEAESLINIGETDSIFVAMGHKTLALMFYLLGMIFVIMPLQMGYNNVFLRLFRGEQKNYVADMFQTGFKNMGNSIVYMLLLLCINIGVAVVWAFVFGIALVFAAAGSVSSLAALDLSSSEALLEMFSGMAGVAVTFVILYIALIVVLLWIQYVYKFTWFIMLDNPEMSAADCMRESRKMTKGKRWNIFVLDLTFIGWYLLGLLGACIPYLWIVPYHYTAVAGFYQDQLPKVDEEYVEVEAEVVL